MNGTGPFRGPALVAGSIKGVRHFNVTHEPALIGPASNWPFLPGENVAEHGFNTQLVAVYGADNSGVPRVFNLGKALAGMPVDDDHVVAGRDCMCGFYAYYDIKHSQYPAKARVAAVIEGYGHVTVGTLGFRAAKASLVAVTLPPGLVEEAAQHPWIDLQGHLDAFHENYPDIPVFEKYEEMIEAHPLDEPPEEAPVEDSETRIFVGGSAMSPAQFTQVFGVSPQMLMAAGMTAQVPTTPPPPPPPPPPVETKVRETMPGLFEEDPKPTIPQRVETFVGQSVAVVALFGRWVVDWFKRL